MFQNYSFPLKIDTIDLYGRKSFRENFLIKVGKKILSKFGMSIEKIILNDLKQETNRKLTKDVSAVIFVGGELIKYKH